MGRNIENSIFINMNATNDLENNIANELAECVFSIKEPLDLSNNSKFLKQNQPLQNYLDEQGENLPLCLLYLDLEDSELVANDRHEASLAVDFSIIYRINPEESRKSGLEKGKKCLEHFVDNIKNRQRNGETLVPFYLRGEAEIATDTPKGIDYEKIDPITIVATAKLILNSIKPEG
jgi:hypothetical protein